MSYAALSYKVKSGFEEEIAAVFSPENFARVDSPFLRDENGEEIGCLVCTGLFLHNDTIVRVIQHVGGAVTDIRRHMSVQPGIRAAEEQLAPYLLYPRDTSTPAGFAAHFDRSLMRPLSISGVADDPAPALLALIVTINPAPHSWLVAAQQNANAAPTAGGPISCATVFAGEDRIALVFQHAAGDQPAVLAYLAAHPQLTDLQWLLPFRDPAAEPVDLLAPYPARCISHLSAAVSLL